MSQLHKIYYQSEIGWLEIAGTAQTITRIEFVDEPGQNDADAPPVLQTCASQLDEYFRGMRTTFDFPLAFKGTDFQTDVWQALLGVPFGETASYADIARQINRPKAVRAVGAANGKNEIVIVAPCHRIIGSDGSLTGYGGGLWRKEWLLAHEAKVSQ